MEWDKGKRPKTLNSTTTRVITECGSLYVTIGFGNGQVVEVFATMGKAGGCSNCFGEALCRSISLGLQNGTPADLFVKGLKGIQCPSPKRYPEIDFSLSCPDAIARVLEGSIGERKEEVEEEITKALEDRQSEEE